MREHPGPSEPTRVGLPVIEDADRVVQPTELEQRLDMVRNPPPLGRLAPAEPGRRRLGLVEPRDRGVQIACLERDDSERSEVDGRMSPELLLPEAQSAFRVPPRDVELSTMRGDDRDGHVVPRHLESVLERDLERTRRVLGRELPAARPQLDVRELVQEARGRRLIAVLPRLVFALEQWTHDVDVPLRAENDHAHAECLPLQHRITAGCAERMRTLRVGGYVWIAYCSPEEGEDLECVDTERIVVDVVGELERRMGMREASDKALLESDRPCKPTEDARLQRRA